tara:strand:+ start:272 stop:652 length:381 start_codon:yes stop_codon:yes gene_type:complete
MAINLDRAEKIGGNNHYQPLINLDPNLKYGNIEVLTINKVPFNKVSFVKNDHYICPNCRSNSLKMILNYNCEHCKSRVIKWKCYVDEKEEKHPYYDSYISRFYEATDAKVELIRKKKAREANDGNL